MVYIVGHKAKEPKSQKWNFTEENLFIEIADACALLPWGSCGCIQLSAARNSFCEKIVA